MTPTTTLADLWHRTGRAARDDRKRLLSLYAVLSTPPVLVVGALVARLLTGRGIEGAAMRRPIAYVIETATERWLHDDPLGVLLFLLVEALALAVPWGLLGGAILRLAAVDLAAGRRESPGDAMAFSRRHWRGFVGARAALVAALLVPLAVAVLVSTAGHLGGPTGTAVLTLAVVVAAALSLVAVVAGSVGLVAGFVSGPTIACEDSDAFDAVSRVFGYAAAGLPRVLAVRLAFLGGVLIGSGWRLCRTAAVLLLGALAIEAGAGAERMNALFAALGDLGGRKAAPLADVIPALAMAAIAAGFVAMWLADLASRVLTARVGAYLYLRQHIDRVPTHHLRTAPAAPGLVDAEAAGFVEVTRIGVPTRRPNR
jgi:hypothetical protein